MLKRVVIASILAVTMAGSGTVIAAEGEARSMKGWPKTTRSVGAGEKVCRMKFSNGERTVWICNKEEPCCEWEALNRYVKCGSTITGCL